MRGRNDEESTADAGEAMSERGSREISAVRRGLPLALSCALLASGCRHSTPVATQPPPPGVSTHREATAEPPGFFDDTRGRPVFTETGTASWYGPNFHHHAAADGSTFDQNAMTAAHRTLPLGSTVRVTNLATGEQVLVRITDRGPFVPGRVIDLSMGAAKACGVYRAGVAKVRLEAYAHASADPAGKWAVQTGAFKAEQDALDLKAALIERYKGARVIEFAGPTGYWVRIDPAQHDRAQAEATLDWIGTPDAQALPYLVRLN
jgi:rare lipoprotein A